MTEKILLKLIVFFRLGGYLRRRAVMRRLMPVPHFDRIARGGAITAVSK